MFEQLTIEKEELYGQLKRMEQKIFNLSASFTPLFEENQSLKGRIKELEIELASKS
jgi:predicted nuclease with TOPRIM domain